MYIYMYIIMYVAMDASHTCYLLCLCTLQFFAGADLESEGVVDITYLITVSP